MGPEKKSRAPRKRKPRPAGRPDQQASVGSSAIIDAALELLRTVSPEKLTVVEVAARAHVDPALVRYYFGDKKGMLHSLAKFLLDEVQERGRDLVDQRGPLRDMIRGRLEMLIEALEQRPHFMQLALKEIYAAGDTDDLQAASDLKTVAERGLQLTQDILKADGQSKSVRQVDARYLHVAILGICTFFMEAKPLLRALFGPQVADAELTRGYVAFATELLARGLSE
jgi:AcrR family transcriptional regulator